jgi:ubiquinone/menaquinone biosynthesis C-methylase UbiE
VFTKSQRFYDLICGAKNYQVEAARIRELVEIHKRSAGKALLDVACGTGGHIPYLRDIFTVEGLDLDRGMLDVARARHSSIPFHQGDMVDFDIGRQFDVIVCLYSSIGYVKTEPRLLKAVANMARHMRPGGVLIVEPFFSPTTWKPFPDAKLVGPPDLKVARTMVWHVEGKVTTSDAHYLVATAAGVEHFVERHEMGLFTDEEYRSAFTKAGLTAIHDSNGLTGRGIYIGTSAEF